MADKSALCIVLLAEAARSKIDVPELSMARHVEHHFGQVEDEALRAGDRYINVLQDLREELADLGFAW